jgi:hypothetical protein
VALTRSPLKRSTGEARASVKVAKCKACKSPYVRLRPMQAACGVECALALGRAKQAKDEAKAAREDAKATRKKREDLMTRRERLQRLQKNFNAWVLQRDKDKPCISCGRFHQGAWHAGHYLSRGARPELATHPDNVHKQCAPCNVYLHGNLIAYRASLIERIGLDAVERLEGPHEAVRVSDDVIDRRAANYAKAVRELKKEQA